MQNINYHIEVLPDEKYNENYCDHFQISIILRQENLYLRVGPGDCEAALVVEGELPH